MTSIVDIDKVFNSIPVKVRNFFPDYNGGPSILNRFVDSEYPRIHTNKWGASVQRDEIISFCEDNFGNEWIWVATFQGITFWFLKEEYATLFKIRFGI